MNGVLILLALLTLQVSATSAPAPSVYSAAVVTIGPGDQSYERFGHNMLVIRDPRLEKEVAFNWGIFDFAQHNFILNFVQGRLWYWMDGMYAQPAIDGYIGADRTVWRQELNLSPSQVDALLDFCIWNAQEANRGYRYDYYADNCSTRARDALDNILNGQLKKQSENQPSGVTKRSETSRLMADSLPLYYALYGVLGHPVDRPISAWEEMFIPMRMRERLNAMSIVDSTGATVPLVKTETVLHQSGHITERANPPGRMILSILVGLFIGALLAGLGAWAAKAGRGATFCFGATAVGWSFFSGVAGTVMLFLWLFTDHFAATRNENVLQLTPLTLPLVVLVPLLLRKKSRGLELGMILAVAAAGVAVLGLILKILPIMNQVNGNIIALAIPAQCGLAVGLWQIYLARRGESPARKGTPT